VQRAVFPATITSEGLPDDEVLICVSTGIRARDGHILEPLGCDLTNYRGNPIVLWAHDSGEPIGTNNDVAATAQGVMARTKFAPPGISPTADRIRGLVKNGIVRAVSVGFEIIDSEPIDPARPRAGLHVSAWELLECSFCSVPVDVGAAVLARAEGGADWKVGAARDLPIEDSDAWDGAAAETSIFEYAGGDDLDATKARKGFLVYDASAPELRGSYKLPIAHVVGGELKVPKGAIRAAASRLPQTDIPEATKEAAGKVLDHYKEKAGMAETDKDRQLAAARQRMLASRGAHSGAVQRATGIRGLGDVACLAWQLDHLGWLHSSIQWEAQVEADNSPVPAMLGEALQQLGRTLVAMSSEEVAEMLSGKGIEVEEELIELPAEERSFVRGGKTPLLRAWRLGIARARLRSGRVLSSGNAKKLDDAEGHLDRAIVHQDRAVEHHAAVSAAADGAANAHSEAAVSHEKLGDALAQAAANPDEADGHIKRAMTHHRALGRNLDAVEANQDTLGLAHGDATDAVNASGRCMRAAARCVRAVSDASDTDTKDIQTSDGTDESEGSANGRGGADFRRRQRLLAELAAAA
jgi:HK97 family phage prohead protease